jgi:hypothetical protein
MREAKSGVVHTEVMELAATPAQVREFIMTPDRILDYYPDPVGGGVLEPGRAIYCRGGMGVSMLERIDAECTDACVVVKVTTAFGLEPPFTRERIEGSAGFTMIEDWELAPSGSGTTLTKTWREVTASGPGPEPIPLADAVREGAIHETKSLIEGWNAAAKSSG